MSETTVKFIISFGVVLGLGLFRFLLLRAVHRYVDEPDIWFRVRRATTYITVFVAAVTLAWIWLDAFGSLATYFGLVSAGVAIALADLLKNIAGWIYIMLRRPLRIGERVEIEGTGTSGDVIDIRLFRFTLMEIGNWVHADQSTGRLIHIPNGVVFTKEIANYTEGFEYIWHEIPVLVTFESNWEKAKAIIHDEVATASVDVDSAAYERMLDTARQYRIKIGKLTPIVYLTVKDSGVLLTGRFLVAARERRGLDERVWEAVLRRFAAEPDINLAYPTVRTFYEGPIRVAREAPDTPQGAASEDD